MRQKSLIKFIALFSAAAFILTGCNAPIAKPNAGQEQKNNAANVLPADLQANLNNQSKIKKFKDYDELAAFLEEQATNQSASYYGGIMAKGAGLSVRNTLDAAESFSGKTGLSAPTAKTDSSFGMEGASEDFSKTNVQIAGVDEADMIKTDGKYVYAVAQNNLFIVAAFPADKAEILAKIEFKSQPENIYIDGDRLVVFGNNSQIYNQDVYKTFHRQSPYSFVKIFDISDRKNPKQVRDLDFEGSYFDSRLIGDNLYFVTNNYNYYYWAGEPVVPRLLENGQALAAKCAAGVKCFAPEVYYFDIPYDSYNFTLVSSLNVKKDDKPVEGDVYVLSGGQNMFVSQNNIYITYTKYLSEYQLTVAVMQEIIFPKLSAKEQEKITEIKNTKNYILNENEKMQKIGLITERYAAALPAAEQESLAKILQEKIKERYQDFSKEMEKTVIHKIAIADGKMEYKTFGEVTGAILNKYSMDENDGYFRIATTKNRTWSQYFDDQKQLESYSNLYVLDKDLKIVGRVEELAKGEQIYSARFMQSRAYLVTYQQTDPLFVIDLANPKNPKVLGELKMPGYSSYLHPYNDNLLIGLGKNTAVNEWGGVTTKGVKLSLYDVSDVANPKEVNNYYFDDPTSNSIALNEPKAFLFSREKNLLVIPITLREGYREPLPATGVIGEIMPPRPIYDYFSGAAVFKVTEKGFELKGKINHSDGKQPGNNNCRWGWCYYDNNVLRSLFISDTLYTFSERHLKANRISDLQEVKNLELKKEKAESDDVIIVN